MDSASLPLSLPRLHNHNYSFLLRSRCASHRQSHRQRLPLIAGTKSVRKQMTIQVIQGAPTDLAPVEVTWQITVGALAGVIPFVVAGIEFGKRIIAQKKCEVCGGSGLMLREKIYVRCQGCGGFLPWQSWKRFFSG